MRCVVYGESGKQTDQDPATEPRIQDTHLEQRTNPIACRAVTTLHFNSHTHFLSYNRTEIAWNYMPYTNKLYREMLQHP
jgi:hypothetical protein